MSYYDFLHSKVIIAPESGIEIDLEEIHPALKPHQRDAVRWELAGGRRGLFERFGLGKTAQELEHQKDRTKARQKPNRKRKPKCNTS